MIAAQLQSSQLNKLPALLYQNSQPVALSARRFVHCNQALLQQWGLDAQAFASPDNLALFAGDLQPAAGECLATVYAGHQFGIYTSQLGDGRVHILGELEWGEQQRWEIQLKGAGATPYARGNNGRMTLAEAVTEYLGCEAVAGLGIASTRALCWVEGEDSNAAAGQRWSVLARAAPTHLRFGHFEYLHNQAEWAALRELAEHVIALYYPQLADYSGAQRYLQFLYAVTERSARLIAQWQAAGFVHSVLNTDNMSIIGVSMDFGVYGFMENYEPTFCPNEADEQQRYAFDQQQEVGRWNCLALAEALRELLPGKSIPAGLLRFYRRIYQQQYLALMRAKLGLRQAQENDAALVQELLTQLQQQHIDYSGFFRELSRQEPEEFAYLGEWLTTYRQRLHLEASTEDERRQLMLANNPAHILRRQEMQEVISAMQNQGDVAPFNRLLLRLQAPFSD